MGSEHQCTLIPSSIYPKILSWEENDEYVDEEQNIELYRGGEASHSIFVQNGPEDERAVRFHFVLILDFQGKNIIHDRHTLF